MNNLNRYNNFVNDVDEESWKSFINECLNSQCFGFDDFYKEFDFSKFDGENSKLYEDVKKSIGDLKADGVYLVFRTAYEVPDVFASKLTSNNMHVFLFMPTNTSYVFKKLPYNWATPKSGEEFAKSFKHYFPRIKSNILKEFNDMNEFDFNEEYIKFMYDNVNDKLAYQKYLKEELERNKKYIDPKNNKWAWGVKEAGLILGL